MYVCACVLELVCEYGASNVHVTPVSLKEEMILIGLLTTVVELHAFEWAGVY